MIRDSGVSSIPTTVTVLLAERAFATSIPMKEEPITTMFFFLSSPTAARMACTSGTVRRRKTFSRSLNPGMGSFLGVPPVARMSFVYDADLPDLVDTVFLSKSTLVTSSCNVSIPASSYQDCARHSSFDGSAIRALESLVRSRGRYGSREIIVMSPLKFCSRNPCTAPTAPLPLKKC